MGRPKTKPIGEREFRADQPPGDPAVPARRRTSVYITTPYALAKRDKRIRALVARMKAAMPWLTPADIPAARQWAKFEVLSDVIFESLMQDGIKNPDGGPHRLLHEWRRFADSQLRYAIQLQMTPLTRAMLKAGRGDSAFDVAKVAAEIGDETNAGGAPPEGDAAQPAEEVPAE